MHTWDLATRRKRLRGWNAPPRNDRTSCSSSEYIRFSMWYAATRGLPSICGGRTSHLDRSTAAILKIQVRPNASLAGGGFAGFGGFAVFADHADESLGGTGEAAIAAI